MVGVIKVIGTVVTVATSAQFGKDMYDKHKTKKRNVKLDEVHKFLGLLDVESLEEAIKSKNKKKLIIAVEEIIDAAGTVKHKSDFEEITEDIQDLAGNIFDRASSFGSEVFKTVSDKFSDEDCNIENPTFKKFRKKGAKLVLSIDGKNHSISINDENVFINKEKKSVTFINDGKAIVINLD